MSKLTALVEAAAQTASEPNSKPLRENFFTLASPATILELCALLEKAEDVLADTQKIMNMWPSSSLDIAVTEALTAIKQWKEMK